MNKYEELFEKITGKKPAGIGDAHVEDPTKNPAVQAQQKDVNDQEAELASRDKAHPQGMKFVDQVKEMTPKKGKVKKSDKPVKKEEKETKVAKKEEKPAKKVTKQDKIKAAAKAKVEKKKAELRKKTKK